MNDPIITLPQLVEWLESKAEGEIVGLSADTCHCVVQKAVTELHGAKACQVIRVGVRPQ